MQEHNFIKTLVLEVRPRLQSVNVFMQLENFIDNEQVKINLNENSFEISSSNFLSIVINCPDLNILSESLSSIQNVNNSISFRFSTTGNDLGSFKREILINNEENTSNTSNNETFFATDTCYSIQCINCTRNLNDSIKFRRVLPLPSENCDPNEWFCHNHKHENQNNTFSLNPKENDLFYSNCYVHLNKSNIDSIRISGKVLVCKYCLNWLGLKENDDTLKLWSNTIQFSNGINYYKTKSLTDVFNVINENIKHILFNSAKVILNCQSSSKKLDTLLMWIIEKKMTIYFSKETHLHKKYNVAKVLYKIVDENNLENQWKNDSSVQVIDVSKSMLVDVLKHLHYFNRVFPKQFSTTNDFLVSYLFMYEPFIE